MAASCHSQYGTGMAQATFHCLLQDWANERPSLLTCFGRLGCYEHTAFSGLGKMSATTRTSQVRSHWRRIWPCQEIPSMAPTSIACGTMPLRVGSSVGASMVSCCLSCAITKAKSCGRRRYADALRTCSVCSIVRALLVQPVDCLFLRWQCLPAPLGQ